MYTNLTSQNPILNQFNGYMTQNPSIIPFQNNQLINQNVHVMNNLNDFLQQHKVVQQNMGAYQQFVQPNMMPASINNDQNDNRNRQKTTKSKSTNIIEEMLKPQKIVKNNKDIESNYSVLKDNYRLADDGQLKKKFKVTNAPYKNIIKDKIVTKGVDDISENDLLVHKSFKGIDDNREKFDQELALKENEKEKINDELKIEFHIDNYDKHKKNFEFKETFIRNLAYEEKIFDDNKQDCVDFYRQKQKEAEEGQEICDQILHNIVDDGVISKDELPTETSDTTNELDLKSIINNIQTDEAVSVKVPIIRSNMNDSKPQDVTKNKIPSVNSKAKKPAGIHPLAQKKLNATTMRGKQMMNSKRVVKV